MASDKQFIPTELGRCPHGQRGLKSDIYKERELAADGRCPHGQRGLKFTVRDPRVVGECVAAHTGSVD